MEPKRPFHGVEPEILNQKVKQKHNEQFNQPESVIKHVKIDLDVDEDDDDDEGYHTSKHREVYVPKNWPVIPSIISQIK